ncbi:MAG: hypothetical protein H7321_10160 [Bacteroidia bacterium]|nr:hypothetical protein [Bacteroidia bacterium]
MRLSKYFSTSVYILIAGLALSGARVISRNHEKPLLFITKQQSSLNVQTNFWQFFSLGQKRLISSVIWISTILESDHEHYKAHDLNSWMFLRFNTISFLEPKFYENYAFGGMYLSIIKDDLSGASVIYNKGLAQYPDDFSLLRDAGFHYYFEVGDFEKSLPIYKKLTKFKNSSQVITSTLARLEANQGNKEDAFNLLKSRYDEASNKNSIVAKKIFLQMYSIKAETDLDCLNAQGKNCSKSDLNGNLYILVEGKFCAVRDWKPFHVRIKKKPAENSGPDKKIIKL